MPETKQHPEIKMPVDAQRPATYFAGLSILIVLYVLSLFAIAATPQLPFYVKSDSLLIDVHLSLIAIQFAFFSIWFALAPDRILRRACFIFLAMVSAVAVLTLSMLLIEPINSPLSRSESLRGIPVVGLMVPLLAGAAFPLLIVRYGFGRLIEGPSHQSTGRPQMTVASLLIVTALVAIVLGAIQLATVPFEIQSRPDIWMAAGIGTGVACGITMISSLIAVFLLLNNRLSFWPYFVVFSLWSLACGGTTIIVLSLLFRWDSEFPGFMLAIVLFGLLLATACGGLRLMGYRLVKQA